MKKQTEYSYELIGKNEEGENIYEVKFITTTKNKRFVKKDINTVKKDLMSINKLGDTIDSIFK